ncbi:MAG: hypothetical protein ACR2NA_02570 [Solirubrobacterales bacterium]
MLAAVIVLSVVCVILALVAFGPGVATLGRRALRRPIEPSSRPRDYDPGRERRAEVRARELMRSVVNVDEADMYDELGLLVVPGAGLADEAPYHGYLIYPHRPLVAFLLDTGELLSEYCIDFPDLQETVLGTRLPDADDVLAKWMALRSDESEFLRRANMHEAGRQVDPTRARRDIQRARTWLRSRRGPERLWEAA